MVRVTIEIAGIVLYSGIKTVNDANAIKDRYNFGGYKVTIVKI